MKTPKNIILLVVDSLRFDSVFQHKHSGLNYTEENGIQFSQARSGGCWTLPSTASLFTGLMPHQHGATSQTRHLAGHIPTLAEKLKSAGYLPYQITGNVVTTDIFGLDRGFDQTFKIWNHVEPKLRKSTRFLMMLSRPRVRKEVLSGGLFGAKNISQYLDAGNVWTQSTHADIFAKTREVLRHNQARGEKSFFFLNLMEAHFPYHVGTTFKLSARSWKARLRELTGLYHTVNQSFLKKDETFITPRSQRVLKNRQRKSWRLIRHDLDHFIQELHKDKDNLVIFCADHGDNFGDQDWFYHFSNVTDAGNHVPLFWLGHDHKPACTVNQPVSLTAVHNSILEACGIPFEGATLFNQQPGAMSVMQSYWYNNHGKTLPKYKYNQFCFVHSNERYLLRKNDWYSAPLKNGGKEPVFQPLYSGSDPIEDLRLPRDRKDYLRQSVNDFAEFSKTLLPED